MIDRFARRIHQQQAELQASKLPVRHILWVLAVAGVPAAVTIAVLLALDAQAALATAGVYFVGILMWAVLRAIGGRRESTRSAQLVLAIGVITAVVADNTAIALTLCMFGLSGIAIAIAGSTMWTAPARDASAP
jgi:hypothetical protein